MTKKIAPTHEKVLQQLHKGIDMPDEVYEEIELEYKSIGRWLDRQASTIKLYAPHISSQGSVQIGTANRPINSTDEYDVDLICRLKIGKSEVSQKNLKQLIGEEVKAYSSHYAMAHIPEDKRRCWTLKFANQRNFHMDILPCIPDTDRYRKSLQEGGYSELANQLEITEEAIAITDKTDENYDCISEDWPTSNPLGYAAWFRQCMNERFLAEKNHLLGESSIYASVDEIPDYKIKTPLQKSIQLLKRHRDNMFAEGPDHKPISIIISTLAARSYSNEETLVDSLSSILEKMDEYIELRNSKRWISNPVNPEENFADKWEEEVEKEENFFKWLRAARRDFGAYLRGSKPEELPDSLKLRLGKKLTEGVLKEFQNINSSISAPALASSTQAFGRTENLAAQIQRRGGTSPWLPILK